MIVITDNAPEQSVQITEGEILEIRLSENPTTGFRWAVGRDGKPNCSIVRDELSPPASVPGQGRRHFWGIQGARAGECEIELLYGRAWENTPTRRLKLHIQVRGK